jgi:hypothetical protein
MQCQLDMAAPVTGKRRRRGAPIRRQAVDDRSRCAALSSRPVAEIKRATRTPSTDNLTDLQLPGSWRLHHHVETNARRIIEIYDASCDLVGLVASTQHPLVCIDAAWRGLTAKPEGERRWWALAIGHAHRDTDPCIVFASKSPSGGVRRTIVTPLVVDGLWVATVSGRQATVSLRQGPHQCLHRISPTIRGRP